MDHDQLRPCGGQGAGRFQRLLRKWAKLLGKAIVAAAHRMLEVIFAMLTSRGTRATRRSVRNARERS